MPAIFSLMGAIDFTFHRRSTKGDWELARQKFFEFVDFAEADGKESLAAKMRVNGESMQFRAGY